MGYTDTILDVKSKRVRSLLGLSGDSPERESDKIQQSMLNGGDAEIKEKAMIG